MTKAEEAALKAYPNILFPFTPLDLNAYRREAFINGYEQAEKDLALTWEDIERIDIFLCGIRANKSGCFTFARLSDEQYQEVLRRFNEHKK